MKYLKIVASVGFPSFLEEIQEYIPSDAALQKITRLQCIRRRVKQYAIRILTKDKM
ncbi:MAG: hypothetical protein QY317_09110 [Candidatus Jettenia caeni]|nr:MAG: hypothetical protein QY317_09110 [Candidatus Jettenia caeni]